MNKRLFIAALSFAALPAFAATPSAPFGPTPVVPDLYTDGLTRLQVPNLTKPERSAFSQMEMIQQLAEAAIQANGCPTTPIVAGLDIYSNSLGTGDSTITSSGGELTLQARRTAADSFRGDRYTVAGSGKLQKTSLVGALGTYRFNKTGSIMEGDSVVNVPNPTASNSPDIFTGRVIKDFFIYKQQYEGVLRDFTLDWGLQVINKQGYPVSKYWQRSWSLKDDGIEGKTVFKKVRIAGGIPCSITIKTAGYNNPEQFNEQGSLTVAPVTGIRQGL